MGKRKGNEESHLEWKIQEDENIYAALHPTLTLFDCWPGSSHPRERQPP